MLVSHFGLLVKRIAPLSGSNLVDAPFRPLPLKSLSRINIKSGSFAGKP